MKYTTTDNDVYTVGVGRTPKSWIEVDQSNHENVIWNHFYDNIKHYDFDTCGTETHDFVFDDGKAFRLEYGWWKDFEDVACSLKSEEYIEEISFEEANVPSKKSERLDMRMYIAVIDEFPDHMVPTLVAHTILNAHMVMYDEYAEYREWLHQSYRKCVIRVNQKEFDRIKKMPGTHLGWENTTLGGKKSCAILVPMATEELPNVLTYAKLWKPKSYSAEKELAAWKEHFDDGNTIFDGEDLIWVN